MINREKTQGVEHPWHLLSRSHLPNLAQAPLNSTDRTEPEYIWILCFEHGEQLWTAPIDEKPWPFFGRCGVSGKGPWSGKGLSCRKIIQSSPREWSSSAVHVVGLEVFCGVAGPGNNQQIPMIIRMKPLETTTYDVHTSCHQSMARKHSWQANRSQSSKEQRKNTHRSAVTIRCSIIRFHM